MGERRERKRSDLLKRGYSDEELNHIYELGRLHLESGQIKRAEIIFNGIVAVAPEHYFAWLGLCCVLLQSENVDQALHAARTAERINRDSPEVLLSIATCLMVLGDYNMAGSYLGEVGDRVRVGNLDNPAAIRLYNAQLARYESRL